MRQATFPSDAALSTFDREADPLPPLLAAELRNLRPTDHERVANTFRYWSDDQSPTSIKEATLTAFGIYGLHRVVGRTEARNAASARVLEKLGMRREAHLIENEWVKGEWQSELVYALLAREFTSAAATPR